MAENTKIYDIDLIIGKGSARKNYSRSLYKIEWISSINHVFDVFLIGFQVDTTDLLEDQLFGQDDIRLNIRLTGYDDEITDEVGFDLTILKTNFVLTPREGDTDDQLASSYQPRETTLLCVNRRALLFMYSQTHKLFENETGLTPLGCVENIIDEKIQGYSTKLVDNENSNTTQIFQLLVPPMSVVNSIKYINRKYPLYLGTRPYLYYRAEDDSVCLWDLRTRLINEPEYTLSVLTKGVSDTIEIIKSPGINQNRFFTYGEIPTVYQGNENITKVGFRNTFVLNPIDKLFDFLDVDAEDVLINNGLSDRNTEFFITSAMNNIERWNPTIVTDDPQVPIQYLTKQLSDMTEMVFQINAGNLPFKRLTRTGVSILLENLKESYQKYVGRYIVKKSLVTWNRHTQTNFFQCNAEITCIRGFYDQI